MRIDTIALVVFVVLAAIWCAVMLAGVVASLPWGLPILILFAIFGYIVFKVVRDRLTSAEDRYYEKNVDK